MQAENTRERYSLFLARQGIVSETDLHPADPRPLTEAERQRILVEWNRTRTDYAQDRCLHHLFEAQVERTPNIVAVVFKDWRLTYQELNQRANQLAHYLQRMGVGPEVPVAICVERSLEMVVGLLGILKAGGAYVPLDPTYPKERVAVLLGDTQTPVLLTQGQLTGELPEHTAQVVSLDTDWPAIARMPRTAPPDAVTPDNLAYVIYTSGSTGRPKGVLIPHRGIVNRLFWMAEVLQLTTADRVLFKTPFIFDVSVGECFLPLVTGARLVVAKPGGHVDSSYLARVIAEQNITFVHFVPSMLNVFLREKQVAAYNGTLRHVWCGGEALPFDLQERFFSRLGATLYNGYGPTEASVGATMWRCRPGGKGISVPIGRPIANNQVYVLDQRLLPVPTGVPGELCIGGAGLARGYMNRPDQTAERFVPHPFPTPGGAEEEDGARLYRTGDLARFLPDGNVEFLGRMDYQVKVRGLRIELGEIEATLTHHPIVAETVVLAREDLPGDQRLVAYVVPEREPAPGANELRLFLKEKLPDYMLPAAFVTLEGMPLTLNGKIDRRALPAPALSRPDGEAGYVAPRTLTEQALADIWTQALGIEQVSVSDNFFELGGHSLTATRVIADVRDAFLIDMPMLDFFRAPTLAGLAQSVDLFRQAAQSLQGPFGGDGREEGEI
jgi:amino acid adenylation domain-containing protein